MAEETQPYASDSLELRTGAVHYLHAGDGEPLVVLHHSTGNPGWIPLYAELARDFRVYVPDLPGYGQSPRPDWARDPRDLAVLAGRIIDRLGLENVTLVGLGFGGFIAAELATFDSSRLGSLVLVGAAGLQPEQGEIRDQMMIDYEEYVQEGFRDQASYESVFGEDAPDDLKTLWDYSREMTARVCWKPYMFNRHLAPLLPDVETPSLVIWGSEDRIVPPSCGEQYARLLPNAALEIVEGAGHLVEYEEPNRVVELITSHVRKALRKS